MWDAGDRVTVHYRSHVFDGLDVGDYGSVAIVTIFAGSRRIGGEQ